MVLDNLIKELEELDSISAKKSFEYARLCSISLRDSSREEMGRRIIINVLDKWDKIDASTHEMWTDLIESAGFYPYLEKEKNRLTFKSTSGEIRKEFHRSENLGKYFHEEQKTINDVLNSERNLIVSAPTSFGKSLLIDEVVASKRYKNIIIIQPTLALIDETRKRLRKYSSAYKIIIRTSQKPSNEKGNLFLFTAERVMEYSELPNIDFFVIDEFYKLSAKRDEERSDVLNNAFNLLLNKHKSRFYLLGPNIDGISEGFVDKYSAEFHKTRYSLVDNRTIDMYSEDFGERGAKRARKEKALFDLLLSLKDEQTIIYCSSPGRVRYLSRSFCNHLKEKGVASHEKLSILEWLLKNVDPRWGLIDCLKYGIGIHDGALQKHITSSIIRYFNANRLKYLFCTTTIIEGVNTSAKNVVFFDRTKGYRKPIDFFDFSNIKGRSGRMMIHYVGRIFNFNRPPEKEDIFVDIPFFDQDQISDEILIHLDEKDVKNKETEQYKDLMRIPKEEREIFRKNGVSVKGQAKILNALQRDINDKYDLLAWNGFPNHKQLKYVLSLAWENLIKSGETTRPMTLAKLVFMTLRYADVQSIPPLVEDNYSYLKRLERNKNKTDEAIFDEAVREVFQILRHWFHYKVPKWLNVMNSLQKHICDKNGLKPGNYAYFSTQIENDFVRENLTILVEYGIPTSAINKMREKISEDLSEDDILDEIREKNLIETSDLIEYEKEKILENLLYVT